jgi:hypothetical protein
LYDGALKKTLLVSSIRGATPRRPFQPLFLDPNKTWT